MPTKNDIIKALNGCLAVHVMLTTVFAANIAAVAEVAAADDFIAERLLSTVNDANAGWARQPDGSGLPLPGATQAQIQAGSTISSVVAGGPLTLTTSSAFAKPKSAKGDKSTDPRDRDWLDVADDLLFQEMGKTLLSQLRPTLLSMTEGPDRRGVDPKYQHSGLTSEVLAALANSDDKTLLRCWATSHGSHTRLLVLDDPALVIPAVSPDGRTLIAAKDGSPALKSIAIGVRVDALRVAKAKDEAGAAAVAAIEGAATEAPDESK